MLRRDPVRSAHCERERASPFELGDPIGLRYLAGGERVWRRRRSFSFVDRHSLSAYDLSG
jgi:hypothetical protein